MRERIYRLKRRIKKWLISTVFKYSNNRYAIAFRQRGECALYEEDPTSEPFILIKNSIKYWRADPFLFKYNGKNYLFAELYDKKKAKGVLAYAILNGNHCGRFHICLEEDFHLSYPCVFKRGDDIYLMPEAKNSGMVTLYRAVEFPKKWEKFKVIIELPCVDTTPITIEGEYYYFTTVASTKSINDNLHLIREKDGTITQLLSNNLCSRSAGNILQNNGEIIRPSQDDTVYGDAVVFNKIVSIRESTYVEVPFRRLLPPDGLGDSTCISVIIDRNDQEKFSGLHTYNVNEDYEVIDLRYPKQERNYTILRGCKNG